MAKTRSSIAVKAANPGKKYDRALLKCSYAKCDNEFYVAKGAAPSQRKCRMHFEGSKENAVPGNNPTTVLLALLSRR